MVMAGSELDRLTRMQKDVWLEFFCSRATSEGSDLAEEKCDTDGAR